MASANAAAISASIRSEPRTVGKHTQSEQVVKQFVFGRQELNMAQSVRELMTENPTSLPPNTSVQEALSH